VRGSIAMQLVSCAAVSLWVMSSPASECDLTTPVSNCGGANIAAPQPFNLPGAASQLAFVQPLESPDRAQSSGPSAPTASHAPSKTVPPRARPEADSLLALFETARLPEPGRWAMPIAGLLGVYAVARRRILSS